MTEHSSPEQLLFKLPFIVEYRDFNYVSKCMKECIELTEITGEPNCISLEGQSGVGKTTLVKTVANDFCERSGVAGGKYAVLYIMTPSPVTVKGLQATMLEALGDPEYSRGSLWDMNARLIQYIQARGVKLIILDEIQHLNGKRKANEESVSDWLKVLIKRCELPFVIVGLKDSIEPLLRANQQLSRLFARRETLSPFPDTSTGRKEFAGFVKLAMAGNGIQVEGIDEKEFLSRLHYCTQGVVANVVNLLQTASARARTEDSPVVTPDMLRVSFDMRLAKHTGGDNAFLLDPNERFARPKAGNRRLTAKAPPTITRKATASDVLKT